MAMMEGLEPWVALEWANENGGRLLCQLQGELEGLKADKPEPTCYTKSFEETKKIFESAGKKDSEHKVWRKRRMLEECITILWKRVQELNPGYFNWDQGEKASERPTFIDLDLKRMDIEIEAAKKHIESITSIPASNDYVTAKVSRPTGQNETSGLKQRKSALPEIGWDDLIKKDLNAEAVIKHYKTNHNTEECLEDLKKALSDAASRALKDTDKTKTLSKPIRINKERGMWSQYAVTKRGSGGEGGGHRYGIIKS